MPSGTIDTLRLFVALYLVLVALTACAGWHRPLLAYPFRVTYSLLRLLLLVVTARRVRMVPLTSSRRGLRALRRTHKRLRRPSLPMVPAEAPTISEWQAGGGPAATADELFDDDGGDEEAPPPYRFDD